MDAKIGGLDTVKVGGPITVPFYIDLSGVSMTDVNSYGVLAVAFDLIFDDEIEEKQTVSKRAITKKKDRYK